MVFLQGDTQFSNWNIFIFRKKSNYYWFVILHAGCKTGFLPGCELVFKTLSTDGRDYHSEINSVIFNKWVEEQLVPALPPKSLVVMDNALWGEAQNIMTFLT
jgi:hypothetical protein